MQEVIPFLSVLAGRVPPLVALAAGIVVAIVCRKRDPRVSTLGLIGFGVALISLLTGGASAVTGLLLPRLVAQYGLSASTVGRVFTAAGVVTSLLAAAAWTLIILALFAGKTQSADQPRSPGGPLQTPPAT
ncbi:MAG: hypothetical protein GEV03_15170 [Streptosporangiales bacterium]|nr:hypothetical protein [Streptosporangiales bacterium]